jgi:hypothetical protein
VPGVQTLQQVVGGEFDVLVPPLGGPVPAGDDAHPAQTAKVAEFVQGAGYGWGMLWLWPGGSALMWADSGRASTLPARTNQDQRDAIAAAMTARQHTLAMTETIGDIVVPAGPW